MADIAFNGGDDIAEPFVIDIGGTAIDVTGAAVTAEVWWYRQPRITLAAGSGLAMLSVNPGEGEPHGLLLLNEAQTATIPLGRVAFVRFVVRTAAGVTMSTGPTTLDRKL